MRLIDADEAKKTYTAGTFDTADDFERVNDILDYAPTIDRPTSSQFKRMAVQLGYEPVVHCKDCKHLTFSDCYGECGASRMGVVSPYDFCSFGERKNDFVEDNKIGERRTDER